MRGARGGFKAFAAALAATLQVAAADAGDGIVPAQGRTLLQTSGIKTQPDSQQSAYVDRMKEGVMKHFMELEVRAKAMHAEGQTPGGISQYIESQLLPMANRTKADMQAELNQALAAVQNCGAGRAAAEEGAHEQEATLSIGESRHNECLHAESEKEQSAQESCEVVSHLIDSLEAPFDMANVDMNSTDAVLEALKANMHYFDEYFPQFMDEDQHCSATRELHEQQSQQCQQDRTNLANSYCALLDARINICEGYEHCFMDKLAIFNRMVEDVKLVEAHTKRMFQTLTCLSRTSMQEGEDKPVERPPCNASTVDTTHLDVFYPSEPGKESCSTKVPSILNFSAAICEGAEDLVADRGNGSTTEASNESMIELERKNDDM